MENKIKTAVIYARYSSDSQTEQSIEGQLRVCQEYAAEHNILVLNTYIDRAMTGTNDNRPDFQRMLKDSNRREWDYVICYKLDRFSRNKYETAIHKKELKDNGVKVVSATEFIPDTPEAVIFESMLEGYAEYYSAELSQKIRRGNNESRRKGNLTGGSVPYGYKNVNKKAVIVDDEAEVVRHIFKQYSLGVCAREIILDLTSKGVSNRGKPFMKNAIYGILKNERYTGIYRHDGEVFDNIYPQIVPMDLFEKVQTIVDKNKYGKTSLKMDYLLKDKIICGYCGRSIIGESGTASNRERKYYYKCQGRKSKLTNCTKATVRKEVLEKVVIDVITEELRKPQTVDFIVGGLMEEQKRQSQANTALNILTREKRRTENSIANIMSAVESGGSTQTAMKRIRELEKKQSEIEQQILIEKSKTSVEISQDEMRAFYIKALDYEPKMLIQYLVKQIILFDDKIQIQFTSPISQSPDRERGFSFYSKKVEISYSVPFRKNIVNIEFEIEMSV